MQVRHPKESTAPEAPVDFNDCLKKGEQIFDQAVKDRGGPISVDQRQGFNKEASALRWFLLPSEAKDLIRGVFSSQVEVPFKPRQYSSNLFEPNLQDYSTIYSRSNKLRPPEEKINEHENEAQSEDFKASGASNGVNLLLDSTSFPDFSGDEENQIANVERIRRINPDLRLWKSPVKSIMKPTLEALLRYKMINNGDRVLVCVSGGKDSLTLLHTLRQYQQQSKRFGLNFELGAMTVDPGSSSYDPSPLIPYMEQLEIPYYYERQCIKIPVKV